MPSPLISIITPAYNHEKYIADCIRSALGQEYQNWEMIIIDDGSVDQTAEIARRFDDRRIRYIYQEHRGAHQLGATYNKALKEARGELIAILEGDDFWPPDKLAVQAPYFADPGVVLAYGDCIITNESGDKLFYRRIPADKKIRDNAPIGSALNGLIHADNLIYAQTAIIRKISLLSIGGFVQPDYLHLVDFPTWCRLSLEGEFKAIPHLLGYWRRNIKSLTLNTRLIVSDKFIRYINDFAGQYRERIRELGIGINLKELEEEHRQRLSRSGRRQNYSKALLLWIYGYNQPARRHFGLYLRQRNKDIFSSVISLLCVIFSYTDILRMLLPAAGVYSSGLLTLLKRRILQ